MALEVMNTNWGSMSRNHQETWFLDSQLIHEPLQSTSLVANESTWHLEVVVNDNFDVGSFTQNEWEQQEYNTLRDDDTIESEYSDKEEQEYVQRRDGDDGEVTSKDKCNCDLGPIDNRRFKDATLEAFLT